MSLFSELNRRNVIRVGAAYLVAAWLLVQVAETIFPLFGFDDTPARVVVIVLAIAFVPTLIFAWAFELTPEGLKKEQDVDRSRSISVHTGKLLDKVIMMVLALALGFFAFDKFVLSESREASIADQARKEGRTEALLGSYGDKSIAVLAFDDMSQQKDQEYLSDGIAEELLNLLTKVPELRVVSRSSAFSYKGKDIRLSKIAEELNVDHILEGSVRKSGSQVRITAQLIDAQSDTHLWSATYDRTLENIFAVQDEIAAKVVEALEVELIDPPPKSRTTDPEIYPLYLQAKHLLQQYTPESMTRAAELYQQVLDADHDYVPAWTDMASVFINQAMSGVRPAAEAMELARDASQSAANIDPEFSMAYAQLGWISHVYDNDLTSAADYYERALELDPDNAGIIGNAAVLAEALGRMDLALEMMEFLAAQSTTNAIAFNNLGLSYYYAGRYAEAEESMRTTVLLSPEYIGAQYRLGTILLYREEYEAALAAYEEEPDEAYRVKGRALALFALGRREEADEALAALIDGWGQQWPTEVAHVYAYRDEADAAFEWLERRYQKPSAGGWGEQRLDRLLQNLHDDPRWEPFLAKMGVSDAQLDGIEFNVTVPDSTP